MGLVSPRGSRPAPDDYAHSPLTRMEASSLPVHLGGCREAPTRPMHFVPAAVAAARAPSPEQEGGRAEPVVAPWWHRLTRCFNIQ